MKLSNLIERLQELYDANGDVEVVVFANDFVYPVLGTLMFNGKAESGCGWEPIEEI